MVKKALLIVLTGLFMAGMAYGQAEPNDPTAQDFATLRKKLNRVKREMDLLIKDMVSGVPAANDAALKDFGGDVSVDILQNDKSVIVKADLPGMEKDKINVALENGRLLKISGSREISKSQAGPGVVRQERFFGNFEKVVELPCEVESFGITATYNAGVLEITIPKKAPAKENKVKISVK